MGGGGERGGGRGGGREKEVKEGENERERSVDE